MINTVLYFLTRFSVQFKVLFLTFFLISGIIFWNVSYFSMTSKTEDTHQQLLANFHEVESLSKILQALQQERFASVLYLSGVADKTLLLESWKQSDVQINKLDSFKEFHVDDMINRKIDTIIKRQKELAEIRDDTLEKKIAGDESVRYYTDALIKHFMDIIDIYVQHDNSENFVVFLNLEHTLEYTALGRDLTVAVMGTGFFNLDWFERLSMLDARAQGYLDRFKISANKDILQHLFKIYSQRYFIDLNQLKEALRERLKHGNSENFDMKLWYQSSSSYTNALRKIVGMQADVVKRELETIIEEDTAKRYQNLLLLLLPLGIVFIISFYLFLDIRFALKVILAFLKGIECKDPEKQAILISANNEFGEVYRALISYDQEVKEQMEINRRTYEYDALTELPNRYNLLHSLQTCVENHNNFSLIYIDIVNFSHINTSFGQDVGDSYLQETATILEDIISDMTISSNRKPHVYRMGSDEFVIVCSHTKDIESIIRKLKKTYLVQCHGIIIPLSFTFGISESSEHTTQTSILAEAEMASRDAAKNHKHYLYFDSAMVEEADHKGNLEWVKKISNAFNNGLFEVHYQPIIESHSQETVKYEVLIRMKDEKSDAIITPGDFLDILQNSGHEKELTKVIIDQSFQSYEMCEIDLSVNMTKDDLDEDMVEYLVNAAKKHNIEPSAISIELVESEEILKENYIKIIHQIKAYGFKLAIDDFGTGYSNFAYLTQIRPDYIKIDGSLIKDICDNEQHARVVEGIYDFAQSLGIKTIAEFVSEENIYKKVKAIGIEYVQGYYLGKVMSCDQIQHNRRNSKKEKQVEEDVAS